MCRLIYQRGYNLVDQIYAVTLPVFTRHFLESSILPAAIALTILAGCLTLTACGTLNSADVKRGDQHLAAGNWEEASVAYRQALKDDPFEPSPKTSIGWRGERAAAAHDERGRQLLRIISLIRRPRSSSGAHRSSPRARSMNRPDRGLAGSERLVIGIARRSGWRSLGRVSEAMAGYMRAVELDPSYGMRWTESPSVGRAACR